MKYEKKIQLKNGQTCILRHGTEKDAEDCLACFLRTHAETDYLATYPDENTFTIEKEAEFLSKKEKSNDEVEILAFVDDVVAGTAGISAIGRIEKTKHRASFGISILREYWHLGIGKAMTVACIECAEQAGYTQIELEVVAENDAAVSLYRKLGFVEYGRNPKGMRSRTSSWQETILMRLDFSETHA